ncbi:MerR family transcriptional regulator [Methylobacterium sp. WSM2598]|uniref:MerR family transcriptional regulator n=1 Tax=Methylobacterium sp. WSM2598 TaxID=398261 RepID=UPI0003729AE1|nr:helix-turn-helix domain-containing protein [Methylobacterium sp. WSM2598]
MRDRATEGLTIGALATRTGVHLETIRYYERIGLVPPPARSAAGHRRYGGEAVRRLIFVRRCRDLGFRLDSIGAMLGLVDRQAVTCGEVQEIVRHHLVEIQAKRADLARLEQALSGMLGTCPGGDSAECPILDALMREPGAG